MTTETVLLHWEGWDHKWNTWIDITKEGQRVKPQGQQTASRPEEDAAEKEFSDRLAQQPSPVHIQPIVKDGNCLFHSVAHQVGVGVKSRSEWKHASPQAGLVISEINI